MVDNEMREFVEKSLKKNERFYGSEATGTGQLMLLLFAFLFALLNNVYGFSTSALLVLLFLITVFK